MATKGKRANKLGASNTEADVGPAKAEAMEVKAEAGGGGGGGLAPHPPLN